MALDSRPFPDGISVSAGSGCGTGLIVSTEDTAGQDTVWSSADGATWTKVNLSGAPLMFADASAGTVAGYGLWAVERRADDAFLGFTGLAYQEFEAAFTPCVEVGWRLAPEAWGHGYATEAARQALRFGFETIGLQEIVSLTAVGHERSRRVMERLGMRHDPAEDFDYAPMPPEDPHRRHVLYRLSRADWPG